MRVLLFSIVLLLVAKLDVFAAIEADKITSLPGFQGTLPSTQYSGYISVDDVNGRYLHYWFIESETDPANAPVVLWLNGGPGCSSLDGLLYEQGPFRFTTIHSDVEASLPSLELNPERWNKIANMIFLEAPAGVGFSYSNTPSDYNTDDNKTAIDNFTFLQRFFGYYPEYANNAFFVAGESYAGVYVPTLVNQIMINNEAGRSKIPLQGFLVGNGCFPGGGVCSGQNYKFFIDYYAGHALFSRNLYDQILQACPDLSNPSQQCSQLITEMAGEINTVNAYNIYAPCINGSGKKLKKQSFKPITAEEFMNLTPEDILARRPSNMSRARRVPTNIIDVLRGPEYCIDGIDAGDYLNNADVRQAIHVRSDLGTWTICTDKINYNSNSPSYVNVYPTLIKNYRTLIYNGDADACVPYIDNEYWTSNIGIPVAENWRAWFVDQQVAGYVTTYQTNNFTFLTVKGAGHMVPQYQPTLAFAMFERFIKNQPF